MKNTDKNNSFELIEVSGSRIIRVWLYFFRTNVFNTWVANLLGQSFRS